MNIRSEDLGAVSRLWRELSEFPASQPVETRTYCFERLAQIIGAANVLWVGAQRGPAAASDPLDGWRPKAVAHLHTYPDMERRVAEIVRELNGGIVDPMTVANTARSGRTRAFLRRELVDDAVWESSALLNEMLKPSGVGDRIIGARPLPPERESFIGLDRGPRERPFGERERDLLHLFLMGSATFHREQLMAQGVGDPPLTPRERQVLALLLTDLSEREIGAELGLTWRTTHQYATSIFKKLRVRGRFGLMALWLRHPPAK